MKSFERNGRICLLLVLAIACATIGCRRVGQPAASTTTAATTSPAPSTTTVELVEVAQIDEQPELPEVVEIPEVAELPELPQLPPEELVVAQPPQTVAVIPDVTPNVDLFGLVPVEIELPAPAFRGTPKPQNEPNVELPLGKPRPPFLAPSGTVNLALGKAVICSDPMPDSGEVDLVTDGDKEASDFGYLGLRPGTEWVQIDLGDRATIYAVLVWHNHAEARVYRDVIVQVSDDPDFIDPQTVFNNDYDNSSGMGIGTSMGYIETSEGKLIDCRGVEGRYVRLYSRGNHIDDKNHYTEVDVYGRPGA